jgi:cytochrome c oxidase subunit 2
LWFFSGTVPETVKRCYAGLTKKYCNVGSIALAAGSEGAAAVADDAGGRGEEGTGMVAGTRMRALLGRAGLFALGLVACGAAAHATEPQPWEINLQPAGSPIMEMIHRFNNGMLVLVTLIVLLVLALLVYCIVRFNARANPVPSRVTHNTLIEVIWTVLPILILVGIAIPSFALLFAEHDPARAIASFDPAKELTVKATGNQWYWSYDYPDNGDIQFDSNMLQDDQRKDPATQPRLLAVDNEMIVPVGVVVRMLVIGNDVIHSWAVPSLGVKIDAIPGRLNEIWFRADREGVYYGQCSELCGQAPAQNMNDLHGHAFMPIVVRAVAPEKFAAWAAAAGKDLSSAYKLLAAAPAKADGVKVADATAAQ